MGAIRRDRPGWPRRRGASRAVCLLCAAVLTAGGAAAADARVPASRAEISLSFAPLAKAAAPAVVNIYTTRRVRARRAGSLFDDPFFRRFFGGVHPFGAAPRERVHNSLGSGVIVRPDGLVVTNDHVIENADEIRVVLADRREYRAEVVVRDSRTDLAVLRVAAAGERLPHLELRDSDTLEVGDIVLAVGNPFGVGQTVTSGIVSALARPADGVSDFSFFIQTDAAINPGNSGGALISGDGRLAGINTAIYSRAGGSNGIGFAIPSNMVATVIRAAVAGGKVVRPWLGVGGQSVDRELAKGLGRSRAVGVLINRLHEGGPAQRAGLRVGDVVLSVNGREIADANALKFRIATLGTGGTARLEILRRGQHKTLHVSLVPPPEEPPRNVTLLGGRNPFAGAEVANLSPALAEELSLDTARAGVIVLGVADGSPAARVGFERRDIVVGVNGRRIGRVRDLGRVLERPAGKWRIEIERGTRRLSVVIPG